MMGDIGDISRNMKKRCFIAASVVLILIMACFIATVHAIDGDVKKMLRRVTGITDADIASAESKKELTLFDAYAMAVRKTERLAIEGENSIQADERKLQAIETFLPYFSLRGSMAFPAPDSKYISIGRTGASLYLRQPIITGLREVSQIKASLADKKIKEFQLYNNAGLLLADVGTAFYAVLLIGRDLKNNEQLLDLYSQQVNELRRRVQIGRSRQSEISRTNAQIYKLQAKIKSLKTNLEHAKLVFATLTGIYSDFNLADTGPLNEPVYKRADAAKLVETRWDVKAAQELTEYAKAGVVAAYGSHLPSIYLEGSYFPEKFQQAPYKIDKIKQGYQNMAFPGSLLPGYLNGGVPQKTREYYFSLGAEFPIFGGDITFAKVREANSKKRQSDLVLTQTVRVASQDIIDSFQTWEGSKIELEAYRKALASAEENYRIVAGEYRLNLVTILDLLTTLTALQTARDDYELSQLQMKLYRIRVGIATNEFSGDNIRTLKGQDVPGGK